MNNIKNKLANSIGISQKKKSGRRLGTKNCGEPRRKTSLSFKISIFDYIDKYIMKFPRKTMNGIVEKAMEEHIKNHPLE